jgi:trigger factor
MQVAVENQSALKRKMSINLPAGQLDQAIAAQIQQASRTMNLKGFRPGKVPVQLITQRYGKQIRQDATEQLIRSSLGPAIDQEKLRLATTPAITSVKDESDGFKFDVEFEVMPDMGDLDLTGIELEREVAEVSDADIDAMIENLRLQRRSWTDVTRAASKDDLVSFEFSAKVGERSIPEQGVERAATIIGSNATLPGIEAALVGMQAGEEKDCEISFPAEQRDADLAGKTGQAHVKVLKVQVAKMPEVDAAFIQSFGVADASMDAFRVEIRSNLERELKNALSARLRAQVTTKLVERFSSFELPQGLIEDDAKNLRAQAMQNAQRQGSVFNQEPDLAPFMDTAKRRVRAGLILNELARKHGLKLDQRRMMEALSAIASTYEDPSEVLAMYRKDQNLMAGLQGRVMEEQVADWITEQVHAREVKRAFAEVIRPS